MKDDEAQSVCTGQGRGVLHIHTQTQTHTHTRAHTCTHMHNLTHTHLFDQLQEPKSLFSRCYQVRFDVATQIRRDATQQLLLYCVILVLADLVLFGVTRSLDGVNPAYVPLRPGSGTVSKRDRRSGIRNMACAIMSTPSHGDAPRCSTDYTLFESPIF